MRPRVLLVVAGGIALAIAAYAVLAPTALPELLKLKDEEKALTADVEKARAENAKLADRVRVLQGGEPQSDAVLEKAAREELGWVKRDEIVLTGLPTAPSERAGQSKDPADSGLGASAPVEAAPAVP